MQCIKIRYKIQFRENPYIGKSFFRDFCKENILSSSVDGVTAVANTKLQNQVSGTPKFAKLGRRSRSSGKYKKSKLY